MQGPLVSQRTCALVLVALLLFVVALFAVCRGRRVQVLLAGGVVFWLLGSWLAGPLVSIAQSGYDAPVEPRMAPRMAFILLGGGTEFDESERLVPQAESMPRIEAALALYEVCRRTETVCKVFVSGGDAQRHGQTEADVYAPYLLKGGVERSDLVLENTSLDTYDNARNVDELLRQDRYDGMVLITSSLHMRRAVLTFAAFGLHPQPFVSSVRNPPSWWLPHPEGWFDSEDALYELVGVVRFYVWRWLGLY